MQSRPNACCFRATNLKEAKIKAVGRESTEAAREKKRNALRLG